MGTTRRALFLTWFLVWVFLALLVIKLVPVFVLGDSWNRRAELFTDMMNHPFRFSFMKETWPSLLVFTIIYALIIGIYEAERSKMRQGREYGDAAWGRAKSTRNKLENKKSPTENLILSQNLRLSLNTWTTRKNCNVVVVGGSGSGKTRFYVKPNLLQRNTSYIVLDPAGEILRDCGNALVSDGYRIKVVNLNDMSKSDHYNAFHYIKTDNDVQRLITALIKNTTPAGSKSNDPFWEKAEQLLLSSLMYLLIHYGLETEKNFPTLMSVLSMVKTSGKGAKALDDLFEETHIRDPHNIAYVMYQRFKSGAEKTLQSIIITASARLTKFDLPELQDLTRYDDLEFETYGKVKTALFIQTPITDSSFNFIAGMIYTQLFQTLYSTAAESPGGHLPIPVHFLMDEFANVKLPEDFENIVATARKHWVFISIILQNMAQIKAIYEKTWESIVGNCDSFIYLGGNEQSTHEYISKALGKETIRTKTYQYSKGSRGNTSVNYNQLGLELMSPDKVRRLPSQQCIVLISGERPILDKKYDLLKHPSIDLTADGKGEEFILEMKGTK